VYTLYRNGSATAYTCSASGNGGSCTISTSSLALSRGDTLAIGAKMNVTNTATGISFTSSVTYTWGSAAIG